ncbi:MAG: hypothetical protein HC765_10460 [Brachymonas sp.]|nr:hypothetical protein [Brachymonas sp.]
MKLVNLLESAFGHRGLPVELTRGNRHDPDAVDAWAFAGLRWQDVTRAHWSKHSAAFYSFEPQAFAYFLPSILALGADATQPFMPRDSLIMVLDRSPTVEYWDAFILAHLVGLQMAEYDALKQWLLILSESTDGVVEQSSIDRSFDTIDLLQVETQKVRSLVSRSLSS